MDEEFLENDGAVELAVTYDNDLFTFETYVVDGDLLKVGDNPRLVKMGVQQVRELVDWLTEMLP